MTDEQVKAFYREIGAVCGKYGIGICVGMWFEGKDGDNWGPFKFWDVTDTDCKEVADFLVNRIERFADDLDPNRKTEKHMREVVKSNPDKN